jgi:predicted Fe-S protein YdhL (DUF1289 family)
MDQKSGLCSGCWRTIDEIIAWRSQSDEGKMKVLDLIKLRKNGVENAESSIPHISCVNTVDKTP